MSQTLVVFLAEQPIDVHKLGANLKCFRKFNSYRFLTNQ